MSVPFSEFRGQSFGARALGHSDSGLLAAGSMDSTRDRGHLDSGDDRRRRRTLGRLDLALLWGAPSISISGSGSSLERHTVLEHGTNASEIFYVVGGVSFDEQKVRP